MTIRQEDISATIPDSHLAVATLESNERRRARHLVELTNDGEWALWRAVVLRGAGFPVSQVNMLASPECARAADEFLACEEEVRTLCSELMNAIRCELEESDAANLARQPLMRALGLLKKGRAPEPLGDGYRVREMLEAYRTACKRVASKRANYHQAYETASVQISKTIRRVAGSERFREAVTWQNRHAVRTGIDVLLRRCEEDTRGKSKRRTMEGRVASYLQRYCTKNDTIGFFGPVGWARFTSGGPAIDMRPGDSLLARRQVYFEHWCIDALAELLSRNPNLRPHLKPHRMPYIHIEGSTLHQPLETPVQLSELERTLLAMCDGRRPATCLAAELLDSADAAVHLELHSKEQVYAALDELCRRRFISWALEVPMQVRPERALRRMLEELDDEDLRRSALSALDELEEARGSIVAAGSVDALDEALAKLEETFTRLTGAAATRSAGRIYAGRTLVYEDCLRDLSLEIGPELRRCLSQPLSLLLKSARWMTAEAAALYRDAFGSLYRELSSRSGGRRMEASEFWFRAQRLIFGERACLMSEVVAELQRRWAKVLGGRAAGEEKCVRYASAELESAVEEAFGGVRRGWRSAKYHSPDVMIAARGVEAIRRGEYELVLGELHVSVNTLGAWLFVAQHPRAEELYEAVAHDLSESRVLPVTPKFFPRNTARMNSAVGSSNDYYLRTTTGVPSASNASELLVGDLVIEEEKGRLLVRSRTSELEFDIIDFFGETLSLAVMSNFKPLATRTHTPRINFDDVVVCRESWSTAASEIEWAQERDETERFIAARRWKREKGMPRAVFVRVPVEVKPFYVDFDSPVYVTLLAKAVQRSVAQGNGERPVTVTEMLPRPDDTWLEDAEGQRYTSELRIAAVDLT